MKASLIVAAGGSGSRFVKSLQGKNQQSPLSKLFYNLAGLPLLERTLKAFQSESRISETVVAIPPQACKPLNAIIKKNGWKNVILVPGGKTRAESVFKALQRVSKKNTWVLVHDGARPFISKENLSDLFLAAKNHEAVILGRKVVPTIKEMTAEESVSRTLDRSQLCEAETPQMAQRSILERAYREVPNAFIFTDEASLMEALGVQVKLVLHDGWNPKITTYRDFELAEAYLNQKNSVVTGFGRDTHRLVEKRKMILGGIPIPFEKGPLGHSDGDALLHAITDAVLGATGSGDIGDWFSDKNPKHKNIASSKMLRAVVLDAFAKGYQIRHIDTVTILEKPKLKNYKLKIKQSIAKLLGLSLESVSIKAKTAEGLGAEGQGLAITCEAIVTLVKKSID